MGNFWEVQRMQFVQSMRRVHFNIPVLILQQISWPLIYILSMYYSYSPFWGGGNQVTAVTGGMDLWTYLFTGMLAVNIFLEYVGVGGGLAYERDFGMLEMVYLTPVHRFLWLLTNVSPAVVTALFSLAGFTIVSIVVFHIEFVHPLVSLAAVLYVIVTSLAWGTFVASIYLIGRNSRFIYAIFETPAEFFSGMRFPLSVLPPIFLGLSLAYPISHGINLLRASLEPQIDRAYMLKEAVIIFMLAIVYAGISALVLRYAELRGKRRGDLSFS